VSPGLGVDGAVVTVLLDEPRVFVTYGSASVVSGGDEMVRIKYDPDESRQDWAISTLFHSALEDSLAAVLEVLVGLGFVHGRDGYRQALAAVRAEFPQLA